MKQARIAYILLALLVGTCGQHTLTTEPVQVLGFGIALMGVHTAVIKESSSIWRIPVDIVKGAATFVAGCALIVSGPQLFNMFRKYIPYQKPCEDEYMKNNKLEVSDASKTS